MSTTVKPLRTLVLVRDDEPKEYSTGSFGIVVPDGGQGEPMLGTVAAVGPEVADYRVGQRVLFPPHYGIVVPVDGLPHRFLHNFDILGEVK